MARQRSGRPTCEMVPAIDIRQLHREGRLLPGLTLPLSWEQAGEPCGTISVRIDPNGLMLCFRTRINDATDWKSVVQHVPVVRTPCHLGGERPWFRCTASSNGVYCGRRSAVIYLGGDAGFACRHCYNLNYASQLESRPYRGLGKARKIRMKLGGDANLLNEFPARPKGMHQQTYRRWRRLYDIAAVRCGAVARRPSSTRQVHRSN
jgi:hypothetical protein